MRGTWVQAAGDTWHLVWEQGGLDEGQVGTWCAKVFKWDDPHKDGGQLGYEDVLHDECVRQSETL